MPSIEDPKGDSSPEATTLSSDRTAESAKSAAAPPSEPEVHYAPITDNSFYSSDYTYGASQAGGTTTGVPTPSAITVATVATPPKASPPPSAGGSTSGGGGKLLPPPPSGGGGEGDEDGMLRMSFLEHLQELRVRLFWALGGFGAAFLLSLTFCKELWHIISAPAVDALTALGVKPPNLAQITPMESFNVIWVKTPVLVSIFIASPWLLYQVWAFVSPGLYKRERRWAVPFVVSTAGLFILGGLFAYFVAFRFGLTFLLGVGRDVNVTPLVSINEYFDLFVNVTLGIALVFELPVLIFFLTLLRLVTPSFLIRNSRYAILVITIVAAVVTPTPDVFNLLLFATPMIVLFFVGVFASYLLVLNREGKKFPWKWIALGALVLLMLLAGAAWFAQTRLHYHFLPGWPFISR